ncbi:MAG: 4a-hydroxytetrahydrobiopterin dehydratase [Marmoricola sp.]
MADDKTALTGDAVLREGLDDWRWVLNKLVARFDTGDFNAGTALVTQIAEAADEANHHPDVDLRYPHVTVTLISHDVEGITPRDVRLARRISELAAAAGVAATQAPDVLEFALDTPDGSALRPFYAALLGYQPHPDYDDDLRDGADRTPNIWFQGSDSTAPDRQRWHLDVSVPAEVAEERLQAVLEAGGTLVDDERAPAFWVVADADGNRSCICTWQGRSAWADADG